MNNKLADNKISACLLVNDETTLVRCLESIKNIADEIIIVDTSPNSINKRVALLYTDKYFRFKWNDSFSEARNFSTQKATGDWVLIIDPDEYIVNAEFIKKNLKSDNSAYYLRLYNLNYKERILSKEKIIRLFKNSKDFSFVGIIHESLVDNRMKPLKECKVLKGAYICHTGYSNDQVMEKKFARNLKLLRKEMAQFPNRKDTYFYLARNYFNQARFLLKKDNMIDDLVSFFENSMKMSKYYLLNVGDDKSRIDDARKLYNLSASILLFKKRYEVKKLISAKD